MAVGDSIKKISVSVGPFAKSIDPKKLKKLKLLGQVYFVYEDWGKGGLAFALNSRSGEFTLYIDNLILDDSESTLESNIRIELDNIVGETLFTFKDIKPRKAHGK